MAVSATLFDKFREKLLSHVDPIDFDADDIRVALLTNSYTPDRTADEFWDDVSANEVSGAGYTTDGELLTTKVIAVDGTGHFGVLTADDITWASSTLTAHYAVVYKDSGTPSTSPLVGYIDFASDESTVSADFKLTWPVASAGGIVKI
jgi:hypothetical protein